MLHARAKKNWKTPAFGTFVAVALGLAVGFTVYEMRSGERLGVRTGVRTAAIPQEAPPEPGQSRCEQLGSACVCDEPLNWLEAGGNLFQYANPSDSPPATECGSTNQVGGNGASYRTVLASVPGVPADATINYVLSKQKNPGAIGWIKVLRATSADLNESWCLRYYQKYDDPYLIDPGNNWRLKVGQLSPLSGNPWDYIQTKFPGGQANDNLCLGQTPSDENCRFQSTWSAMPSGQGNATFQLTISDCQSSWCRFEMCIDTQSNGSQRTRVKTTIVNSGVSEEYAYPYQSGIGPVNAFDGGFTGIDAFTSILGGTGLERIYFSSMMVSEVPLDGTHWPGCEPRIEGATLCPVAGGD